MDGQQIGYAVKQNAKRISPYHEYFGQREEWISGKNWITLKALLNHTVGLVLLSGNRTCALISHYEGDYIFDIIGPSPKENIMFSSNFGANENRLRQS